MTSKRKKLEDRGSSSKYVWTREKTSQLIELMAFHSKFNNRKENNCTHANPCEIPTVMDMNASDVAAKIRDLRCRYKAELRNLEDRKLRAGPDEEVIPPSWEYFSALKFLSAKKQSDNSSDTLAAADDRSLHPVDIFINAIDPEHAASSKLCRKTAKRKSGNTKNEKVLENEIELSLAVQQEEDSHNSIIIISEEPELIINDIISLDDQDKGGDEGPGDSSIDENECSELMTIAEPELIPPMDNCSLIFICTKCSAPFHEVHQLNAHYSSKHNIHSPEDMNFKEIRNGPNGSYYECLACKSTIKGSKLLFMHSVQHDAISMFKCKHCRARFRNHENTISHGCRNAFYIRKYVKCLCPSCGKECSSATDLKNHLSGEHNIYKANGVDISKILGLYPPQYICNVCNYLFDDEEVRIADLRNHAFSHMPFKLYNCNQCQMSCVAEEEMIQHLIAEHKIDTKKKTRNEVKFERQKLRNT